MTKQDLAEVLEYVEDLKAKHRNEMQGLTATAHGCAQQDQEELRKVRKELAEVKSKLGEAKAEIHKANTRGLRWMEAKNHWENRALIAEEGYRRKHPSNVDETKITEQNPLRLLVEVVPKKDEKHALWQWRNASYGTGAIIEVFDEKSEAAMSIQELPPMPSLTKLWEIFLYGASGTRPGSLTAVLEACGLEVE